MTSFIAKLALLLILDLVLVHGANGLVRSTANFTALSNGGSFVRTSGIRFTVDGNPLYLNGFNAYWMMYMASDPSTRDKVTGAINDAVKIGMNVGRTWAFNDGGDRALQMSPGVYNEQAFQGLDFVVSEAKRNGMYLILSLVNNWDEFGGKKQYVQWAREHGQSLSNDDEFFTNPMIKEFYKNHVRAMLTRFNSITGVAYKDEPTIIAWELMNEPRCLSDGSGKSIQDWVNEMAAYVKSIDSNHMLEIGLEGFYGPSEPRKVKRINPNSLIIGTDFISNNQVPYIDFATIHLYPDQWVAEISNKRQAAFVDRWVKTHMEDSMTIIQKPLMIAEFGLSWKSPGYSLDKRNRYFAKIYNDIYVSSKGKGACVGGLFWQMLAQGMSGMGDGYEVVLADSPSTATLIAQQSNKMLHL